MGKRSTRRPAREENLLEIPAFLKRPRSKKKSLFELIIRPPAREIVMPPPRPPTPLPATLAESLGALGWDSSRLARLSLKEAEFYAERRLGPECRFAAVDGLTSDQRKLLKGAAAMAAKTAKKTSKKASGATVKVTTAPKTRKPGSGALIRELIMKNVPTDDILKEVKKAFPDSKAGAGDVAWNRAKLRSEGKTLPAGHQGRQKSEPSPKKTAKAPAAKKPIASKKAGPKPVTAKVAAAVAEKPVSVKSA